MCWLCRLRLLGQLFLEERSEVETCPGCGEAITSSEVETPDGYDDIHCRRCAREIEQRQDWFMNTATPIGGSN
jgi:uncharacterized paraquat-inducible protein A